MKKLVLLLVTGCITVFSYAQDAAEKITKGNEALQGKEYAKALELYESAMSNLGDVQVPDAINFNIGWAAYNSDSYEKAVQYFDKAIAAKVQVEKCYEYKANAYTKMKKYNEAVETYKKAIEASPAKAAQLSFNAGITAYKGKIYNEALTLFTTAVDGNYKGATAQYYKAVVCKKLGKNDEYKTTLEEGVAKFAGNKKLTKALAQVYVKEGNKLYKKGADILSKANEKVNTGSLSTADAAYTTEVGKSKKEFSEALAVLKKAAELDASNANAKKLIEACNAAMK